MKLENPFPEYGYFGPVYFCDRGKETAQLMEALPSGDILSTTAFSDCG
jgi:hypothetical protein